MENVNSKISVVVLTKNEAGRIGDCLTSLGFADEIIVIDNGSTDDTVKISEKHRAVVYQSFLKDFSKLRNLGLSKAKFAWILYIDADERVTPKLQTEILNTVKSFDPKTSPHGYFLKRKNYYLSKEWPFQDKLERFFWKKSLQGWYGSLHETAKVDGKIGILYEPLNHYTHRTLTEMADKTNEWSVIEAELRLEAGHPTVVWWRLLRVMLTGFWNSFISQEGWKAGVVGWIESIYQGFSMFITYAKLWELQEANQKSKIKNQK